MHLTYHNLTLISIIVRYCVVVIGIHMMIWARQCHKTAKSLQDQDLVLDNGLPTIDVILDRNVYAKSVFASVVILGATIAFYYSIVAG